VVVEVVEEVVEIRKNLAKSKSKRMIVLMKWKKVLAKLLSLRSLMLNGLILQGLKELNKN
jgi:hypothetical protein